MKYFLHISYDGSNYRGWQRQANAVSVQETIEDKLQGIFKKKITVMGCGRTDAGVHASQYVLHIEVDKPIDFDLKFRLNKHLPNDIAVYEVIEMELKQHARFDPVARSYDYFIHSYADPILSRYSSLYELEGMDFDAMKKVVDLLPSYEDYRGFCRHPDLYHHTLCKVSQAKLYIDEEKQRMRFSITANRFLRGMIRLLVSSIIKVGNRELSISAFEDILIHKTVDPNKKPAYPNGLFLSKVKYPYLKLDSKKDICRLLKK